MSNLKENVENDVLRKSFSPTTERFRKGLFLEKLQGQRSHEICGKNPQMQPGTPRLGVWKMVAN